jgi:DNA-directed RNA polymerase specialized sigma24 family protein
MRTQPDRLGRRVSPILLEFLSATKHPWHEELEDVRAGLRWGREKERLLAWVESQMRLRLTAVERRSIHLYYFRDRNYRQAAEILGVNPSSVYRAVQRGLRKLREAAEEHPPAGNRRRRRREG